MKYFVEKVMKAHSSSWGEDFHKTRVQYAGIKKIDFSLILSLISLCWWGYFASVSVFHIKVLICISGKCNTDAYSEPSWTSKMELLASGSIKKLFFDLSKISIVLTFISFWYFLQYISGHIQKQTLHSWQKALKSFFGSNFYILFII